MLKYYRGSLLFTLFALVGAAYIGFSGGGVQGALSTLFIVAVLGVLEVSLSFDNAVVNAKVLAGMDPVWRHRFLTWGIAIAVFGMRVVFPLVIVAVIAHISPWDAVVMAASNPSEYARILTEAHVAVSAFGGTFLMMVGLKHFIDSDKEVHWISVVERPLSSLGRVEAVQLAVVLLLMYFVSGRVPAADQNTFLISGIFGLICYILVDGIGAVMDAGAPEEGQVAAEGAHATGPDAAVVAAKAGLGAFLYLEVLDASFSFDGVIGAFALSTNLLVIALGLGIGAMFVRSMTVMLVDKGTLGEYRFLEHGAFYAIICLGVIMLLQSFMHIPEVVTGLLGAAFIAVSVVSSVRWQRKHPDASAH